MRRFSKYTLLLAAPLALASSGCVSGTSWVWGRGQQDPAYYQQRLVQAAQRYEDEGQYESAYRMYSQLAVQQPNNQVAQQKLQQLAQKVNSAEAAGTADQVAPKSAEQALKMLAQIQAQHREEVSSKRRLGSRNPDVMLAEIQAKLDAYKAEQSLINGTIAAAPAAPSSGVTSVQELPATVPARTAPPTVVAANRAESTESSELTHWDLTADQGGVAQVSTSAAPLPAAEILPQVVTAPAEGNTLPQVVPARSKDWQTTSLARLCDHVPAELHDAMALLDSSEDDRKVEGLSSLALQGEAAKPVSLAVRALLKHENPTVRAHAAEALFAIEHDTWDAVNTLTELLSSRDETIVQLSCYILGQMGPAGDQAIPHLEIALANKAGLTSLHAAEALLRISGNHADAFDVLDDALASDDRDLRWFGAVAMGSVRGELSTQAAEALKESLHDEEADVRAAAALSLGGMGQNAEAAISELEQVALFDDEDVRNAASTALACLRR